MSPGALAQRRQFDCGARKRVEQFGAEMAGGDHIGQRQIAGGDDPHIDLVGIARADGPDLLRLHRFGQPILQVGGEPVDLVQHQGAAVAMLQGANLLFESAGEGALFMPEQHAIRGCWREPRRY